jgi:hypothetical protein
MQCLVSLETGVAYALRARQRRLKAKYGHLDRAVVLEQTPEPGVYRYSGVQVMVKSANKKLVATEVSGGCLSWVSACTHGP